jgi:hypothetical protein
VTRRGDVPQALGATFATAAAREAGVSASRLRANDLDRPFHGVRALRRAGGEDGVIERDPAERRLLELAEQFTHCMTEHQFFSHVTAAVIWGLPLPPRALRRALIDVSVFAPRRNPESSRVRGHEVNPRLAHVQIHEPTGLRVTSPASTWAMLGAVLRNPYDLIAVGDAIVRQPWHSEDPPALATIAHLEKAIAAGRRSGVVALREAIPRVRVGSASRPETWARLTLIDGGLPEPVPNLDVFHDQVWIARVDLAYPAFMIAVEYEGEHHLRDPEQWARDLQRYDMLAEAGWRVIRITKQEVFSDPAGLCRRVRRAIAQATR